MTRLPAEDLHDIILLAANGKSSGSMKLLRGMYKHLVTAIFMTDPNAKVWEFAEDLHLQRSKILERWFETCAGEIRKIMSEEDITLIRKLADDVKVTRKGKVCALCGRSKTMDFATMAKKLGCG